MGSTKAKDVKIYQLGYLIVNALTELFDNCKYIDSFEYDEDARILTVKVNDRRALGILQDMIDPNFGYDEDCDITLEYIYAGDDAISNDDIEYLFTGSKHFSRVFATQPPFPPMRFIGFKKEVIQYSSDDISDPNGITSTLAADIAKKYLINTGCLPFTEKE